MGKITVGVLTISDRCANEETTDESGQTLVKMIENGIIEGGVVQITGLVPDEKNEIKEVLAKWCDENEINVILTSGGTGIAARDVTPEATIPLLDKIIPGISQLILMKSLSVTPLAALSRAVAGVRRKSLILNFPGSQKACKECLEAVSKVIPHAVALIIGVQKEVEEEHLKLKEKKINVSINSSNLQRKSTYTAVEVKTAQKIIQKKINLLVKVETVDYEKALGYVLAEDAVATDSLPPINVSKADGYAIPNILEYKPGMLAYKPEYVAHKTEKLLMCSGNFHNHLQIEPKKEIVKPPTYSVLCTYNPGTKIDPNFKLTDNTCVKVSTGGPIPSNTVAVVRVEGTTVAERHEDGTEKKISLRTNVSMNSDIRMKGSDYERGEVLLQTNLKLNSAALGLLASAGITSVRVYKKPVVGVISTGDEIVEPRTKPSPSKVRDSNRIFLLNLLKEEGYEGVDLGLVPDDPESLYEVLAKGFRVADIVVTTGSMSMGEKDLLKDILIAGFEAEICFGRVSMKPGLPTAFGVLEFEGKHKAWFGFPGNPASAVVASHLFLLPALKIITKDKNIFPKKIVATLKTPILNTELRPHYVRGFLSLDSDTNAKYVVSSTGDQMSSRIASCVNANCLIYIPKNENVEMDSEVQVYITGKTWF